MTPVPISRVRKYLADIGNRVSLRGERVIVKRRGKSLFAIVPVEDVELLERLEDQQDIRSARKALKERGPNVPWDKVKNDLRL